VYICMYVCVCVCEREREREREKEIPISYGVSSQHYSVILKKI